MSSFLGAGQNGFLNKLNFDISNFFIENGFSELDIDLIGKINGHQNTLGEMNYSLQLNSSLLNGVIDKLLNKRQKLENKGFSIEKGLHGYNIIFYINCKAGDNLLNKTYDYLLTISGILGLKNVTLRINNDLEFLEKGSSFGIIDNIGESIGYLGKITNMNKIKGDLYICEIIVKH